MLRDWMGGAILLSVRMVGPSEEAADYPDHWSASRAIDAAWQGSSGWLERCHLLQDHWSSSTTDLLNLVPLCVLCNEEQPPCGTRASGITFVNSASPRDGIAPWMQFLTDDLGRGVTRPGRSKALRTLRRRQLLRLSRQNQSTARGRTSGLGNQTVADHMT